MPIALLPILVLILVCLALLFWGVFAPDPKRPKTMNQAMPTFEDNFWEELQALPMSERKAYVRAYLERNKY